jgi:hypothetical protein
MLIDFVLDAECNSGKALREANYQACLALLGALPMMGNQNCSAFRSSAACWSTRCSRCSRFDDLYVVLLPAAAVLQYG